jgi:hypothetical protein
MRRERKLLRVVNKSLRASGGLSRIETAFDTLWKAEESFILTAQGLGLDIQGPINSTIALGEVWGGQVELEMLRLASKMSERGDYIWSGDFSLGAKT